MLSGCLIVAILAFVNLLLDKFKNLRKLSWLVFFIANLGLALCWLFVFFLDTIYSSLRHFELNTSYWVCFWACFISWVMANFFTYIWLEMKFEASKTLGLTMMVISFTCVFIFTFESIHIIDKQCKEFIQNIEILQNQIDSSTIDSTEDLNLEVIEGDSK